MGVMAPASEDVVVVILRNNILLLSSRPPLPKRTMLLLVVFILSLASLVGQALSLNLTPPNHKVLHRRDAFGSIAATIITPFLVPTTSSADIDDSSSQQGIAAITDSQIGRAFRKSVVRSAQVADKLDEKWERFSDSLRNKSQCDPNTGRRLYDNGKRKDGTPIGSPGLGELCSPEPLAPLDVSLTEIILDLAVKSASLVVTSSGDSSTKEDMLRKSIQDIKELVRPAFERSMQGNTSVDETNRALFGLNLYATLRAITNLLKGDKAFIKAFQVAWGSELLAKYASTANRKDFVSPFPKGEDEFEDFDYDKNMLLDALGKLTVTLKEFKAGGLLGYFEVSIPYDDYGSVVTVAMDDYTPIGAEILLSEQKLLCDGPVPSLLRSLFDDTRINFSMDTFYIDPSTTRQDDYNPTQLLLSLSGLRKM